MQEAYTAYHTDGIECCAGWLPFQKREVLCDIVLEDEAYKGNPDTPCGEEASPGYKG
jgi:hypothetical protein